MLYDYIFGIHSIQATLEKNHKNIIELYLLDGRSDRRLATIIQLAKQYHVVYHFCSAAELDQLVQDAQHQGVVAKIQSQPTKTENDLKILLNNLKNPALLLILDCVQDPHNLGACLRSADAAGVNAVITPKDNAVALTPTVRKVASGAAEHIPFIQVKNLARTLKYLKEQHVWLYGTSDKAKTSIYHADLTAPTAIIMGAEGTGLRRLTAELCDELLYIPMSGSVSSLNVSVATGIFLFEAVRQRRLKG
ncbi:MAG: 23S rRNA (guanosine(2251)-2'-O)-methyltransferase RlmB [Gammaproteobacteria bacterium]